MKTMWGGRTPAVKALVALLASASIHQGAFAGKTYIVNNPNDEGSCVFGGRCDLRGAWNEVSDWDQIVLATNASLKTPLGAPRNAAAILLVGSKESPMYVTNGREESGYHREFIRWTSFNASNGLQLADITVSGFSSSQPGGRNVQEFGGAINLGCVPQEGGYNPAYCRNKLNTPAVTNVVLGRVEFSGNTMRSSSPGVNDQYGAALAVCCEGCGVDVRQSAFLRNVLPWYPDEVQAGGAIFTDVSQTSVTGSVFQANGFGRRSGKGADIYACGPVSLTDSNFTKTRTHGGSAVQTRRDLKANRCLFAPATETSLTVLEAESIEAINSLFALTPKGKAPLQACYSDGYISMERVSFDTPNGAVLQLRTGSPGTFIWNKYPGEGHGGLIANNLPFAGCTDQLDACNPLQKCVDVYNSTLAVVGWSCQ